MMLNKFAEVTVEGADPFTGAPFTGTRTYPAYTCGHCSNVVIMRQDRERERKTCYTCGKMICEKTDLCGTHCTPLHAMAADHFEGAGEHGKYVSAIMAGAGSIDEAKQLGLIYQE